MTDTPATPDLRLVALNCTLKRSPAPSSTDRMLALLGEAFSLHGATGPTLRVVDFAVAPGVTSDEGPGDQWPALRRAILEADILVVGTPIWLGHPASVCQQVLERLDAFLGETGPDGRPIAYDRVAAIAVVGNEDGAHHVVAEVAQALNDVGFTLAAQGAAYWVGEAMQKTDFLDLDPVPAVTLQTIETVARTTSHLARALRDHRYPSE
jgi:multimeric flavodoxin WrbA